MIARNFLLASLVVLANALHAMDFSALRLGDIAGADLVAPVALDVPDAAATAARRQAVAATVPFCFRDFPLQATNGLMADFNLAFETARKNFSSALAGKYSGPLDDTKIYAPEFTAFLKAYNLEHPAFPPNYELAAEWARGGLGADFQAQLGARLQAMMHRAICDDLLTNGLSIGNRICLIRVARNDDAPTVDQAKVGKLASATNLIGIARVRMIFRHSFPKEDGDFAMAISAFLRPVCAPDVDLTRLMREAATREIKVTAHYEPGQIIVRHGEVVDAKALAAIESLRERNLLPKEVVPVTPAPAPVPVTAPAPAALPPVPTPAPPVAPQAVIEKVEKLPTPVTAHRGEAIIWIAVGFVAVLSLMAVLLAWRAVVSRTAQPNSQLTVSQALRDALVQELAATRVELVKSQQFASARVITANAYEKTGTRTEIRPGKTLAGVLAEAQSLAEAGELEKSLKCFDAALAIHPENADALVKMGGVLEKLGRTDEALDCFDRAIAADETQTLAYLLKGGLLNRVARHEEAAHCYEQALLKQKKSTA